MKLPKIKLNLNIKSLLNYVFVVLISSVFVATILISLPLTEKYLNKTPYNLISKDSKYWSKEYILDLETQDQKILQQTRDILFKRLNKYGVEQISIRKAGEKSLQVILTSSKDKDSVEQLFKNRFAVDIVTRKSDVNFEDSENPYAYLLATNYDTTDWTRDNFRNVYITKLKNSSGTESYFAIFKLWPKQNSDFQEFLKTHESETIGVSTDGFVSPFQVPAGANKLFAVPISTEDSNQIKLVDILYNTGTIDTNIKVASEKDLTVNIPQTKYLMISLLIFVGLLITYAYLLISKNAIPNVLVKSFLATTLTLAIYITFLKLFSIPVDIFILPIEAILTMILVRVISENDDSVVYIDIILFVVLAILTFTSFGYVAIVSQNLLILLALSKIALILSSWYINKVKKI